MNKDDEADMADRVLMASDWAAMWAHIAVEAQSNPTYAIAYAILMLAEVSHSSTAPLVTFRGSPGTSLIRWIA